MRAARLLFSLALALALIAPNSQVTAQTTSQPAPQSTVTFCGYSSQVDDLLGQTSQESWSAWVRRLSGAEDVLVGGKLTRIRTRYSTALFNGTSPGFDYVREQIAAWYPAAQIEVDPFPAASWAAPGKTWHNLILTIPGSVSPGEVVILSAHLDSASSDPLNNAPGADDNASGAAALLEAARVLRGQALPRTLRLIWFTGEEQGMIGSIAYTQDHSLTGVVGVVNVDMVGYDGDGDRCFELHVGVLPASNTVGQCFVRAIQDYNLDLRYDYLTTTATNRSDHASFWPYGVGAVEVLENAFSDGQPNGCSGRDANPHYHTINDTFANLTPAYGYAVSRASLATAFSLASPGPVFSLYMPLLLKD